jgi:hypothetical protein
VPDHIRWKAEVMGGRNEEHGLALHFKWVFGAESMREVYDKAAPFSLDGHLKNMRCPYLVLHGSRIGLTAVDRE